jgi:hypothetical protein
MSATPLADCDCHFIPFQEQIKTQTKNARRPLKYNALSQFPLIPVDWKPARAGEQTGQFSTTGSFPCIHNPNFF